MHFKNGESSVPHSERPAETETAVEQPEDSRNSDLQRLSFSVLAPPTMLPLLLYLSAFSLLAGAAAQDVITDSSALNISSCPITFMGQTYTQIYVSFLNDSSALCFDDFYGNDTDCLLGPKLSRQQAVLQIEDGHAEEDFLQSLPSVKTRLQCTVNLMSEYNGAEITLVLANFGTQAALLINTSASNPVLFEVQVNGEIIGKLNFTEASDDQQLLAYADLSGCRLSGEVYQPNTLVNSDSANCINVTCDETAVLTTTGCGFFENCQGNGICMKDTTITCTVTGPTVIDFHGQLNTVEDRCAYSLLSTPLVPDFLLLANFQERRRKDVSFLDSVTLKGAGFQIHLEQGRKALLDDTPLTLSAVGQVVHGVELSMSQTGVYAIFPLANYRASLFFDGTTAQITLIGPAGQDLSLQGFCSNSNQSLSDLRLWDYSSIGCETQYTDTPDSTINCTWATKRCNLLKAAPFTICHSVVDPEPYISACTDTLCSYPAVDGLDCQFLDAYDEACSLQHILIMDDWRTKAGCPKEAFCPDTTCSDHEFCAERFVGGGTSCFCRAIFGSKYTSIGALGDPTVCGPDSASLTLVGCLLEEKGIDYSTLHLNDPTCKGQMNEQTHMVTFSFDNSDTCGTVIKNNGSQIMYENTIVSQNTSTNIITRHDQIYIDFSCIHTQPDIKTLSFKIKDNSVVQHITSGAWIYNLTMKAYTDPALAQFLDSNTEVQLNQRIWVELQTNGLDGSLVAIVTDSCWATYEPSPDASVRYDLVLNGCPNPADQTVRVQNNGVGTSNSFSFNMFQFTGSSGDVYLHCRLHLCVMENSDCAPVCSGGHRRRRAAKSKYKGKAAFITMTWIN
ncbi:LOW QUALITY PROTEIN: alpha-tectorin-like [Anabas testudineus]|uniref:LOW QUALITY PROTEIN: alpha-tectorin-like n=1 Tax=Anabas testudineus TaxID=64144 RepID=UPI000E456899|nr:LOW QUALITY PROTEIN: alpha-tectorin-like [Anabas testudineus]